MFLVYNMGNCIGMSLMLKHKYQMQADENDLNTTYELYPTQFNVNNNHVHNTHSNIVT